MSKRRMNGEGSVFQVAENKWVAKISLGTGFDGKPKIKQFSGKTEAVVKKKLREFKKSSEFLGQHMPSEETVKSYFAMWLKEYQYNKLKPSSFDRLESTVNTHITPAIGRMKIDKVKRENIQALINELHKHKGLSYSSVKKVYVALNSMYKHALIADLVVKNPCMGIILPSANAGTKEVKSMPKEEIELLKKAIEDLNENADGCCYSAAYILILNTGLRMGEALSLRWTDVDFVNKTITISKNSLLTKKRDGNGNLLGGAELKIQQSTKTTKGKRIVPINKSAEKALEMLRKNNTTDFVIVNSKQKCVLPSNFERSFHNILTKAGIQKYGIHSLRHTFASMLFSKGVDVKIVSNLLGHSTVKVTYDIYVHLFENDVKHITEILD